LFLVIIMSIRKRSIRMACTFLLLFGSVLAIVPPVSAADAYYTGYLGDVIDIHGVSYVGNTVYLFVTGPGLPENGAALNDPTMRADQGHFTVIGVDTNYQWLYKWDTQRIRTQIGPGAYTVYVTTEPVDLAHLGGTSTYQTLEVDLADTNAPQGESGPGTYTLKPEEHSSTVTEMPTLVLGTPNATPASTTVVTSTPFPSQSAVLPAGSPAAEPVSTSVTHAAMNPETTILPILCVAAMIILRRIPR